jgi:heptosyltransferase-2
VVIRDICPWRPCFDYCKFSESYCLTKLGPEKAWPEIRDYVGGLFPSARVRAEALPA